MLEITIQGVKLTQEQLDAIVPVINRRMQRHLPKKKFEEECLAAMDAAGCPISVVPSSKKKCTCDLRTKLVGDGCEACNPEMAEDIRKQNEEDDE